MASTPLRMRAYLLVVAVAAIVLPLFRNTEVHAPGTPDWLTVAALIVASVVNVEVSRWLSGGVAYADQAHKALSAWAFATALLLPTAWLLVVVPATYTHARWRGIRVLLWKWVGSALYLVLCGVGAGAIRQEFLGAEASWLQHSGLHGFLTVLTAAAAFLALETMLFAGSAFLNRAEDERWLRATLASPGFYLNETGVLLIGGLFSATWIAGPWFCLFFIPVYILVQHAVLLAPLRERAAAAATLAAKNGQLATINRQLEVSNADLNRANTFKTDLMSMLGHEIANPLTSVIGFTETAIAAIDEGDGTAARDALAVVDRNAEQVAAVLADIVQLVATETGTLRARPERCELMPRLQAAVEQLPSGRRPEVSCPPGLAVLVQPGHLDQILANLLSNASKYAGGATSLRAQHDPAGHVAITVTDHGPGIADSFREHLFERYRRGHSTATSVTGTGFGLFISRELARANCGDLVHLSHDGGSHFVIRLPQEPSSKTP